MKRLTRLKLDKAENLLDQVEIAAEKGRPGAIGLTPEAATALAEAWMHLAELEEKL